jgi:hypothetical protein
MSVVHLDPWQDIVNVHWGDTTVTHVAVVVRIVPVFDGTSKTIEGIYQSYDYVSPSITEFRTAVGVENVFKKAGTSSWQQASFGSFAFGGFESSVLLRRMFSKNFIECEAAFPIRGIQVPGSNSIFAIGWTPVRDEDVDMFVPSVLSVEKFSSIRPVPLFAYFTQFDLCTPGDEINATGYASNAKFEIAPSIVDGVSVSFEGRSGTLSGVHTPTFNLLVNISSSAGGEEIIPFAWRATFLYDLAPE